jgi:hypothetical protein
MELYAPYPPRRSTRIVMGRWSAKETRFIRSVSCHPFQSHGVPKERLSTRPYLRFASFGARPIAREAGR